MNFYGKCCDFLTWVSRLLFGGLWLSDCVAGRAFEEGDEAVAAVFVVVDHFDPRGDEGGGQEVQALG
jgi:hypothetical protein